MTTLKKWLNECGLKSCRAQAHTFETISGPIEGLRKRFPTAGAAGMWDHLRQKAKIWVPRCALVLVLLCLLTDNSQRKLIMDYNKVTDPIGVAARRAGRIRRHVFYAAGVNHIWAFDQHDKWQHFGLKLHLGIEPFTGFLLWIIVWWTNSNPKLVGWEYFRAARKYGGKCPLISSDIDVVMFVQKAFQC